MDNNIDSLQAYQIVGSILYSFYSAYTRVCQLTNINFYENVIFNKFKIVKFDLLIRIHCDLWQKVQVVKKYSNMQ